MIFRSSQVGNLVGAGRSKKEVLSETAKSYIEKLVKEHVFNYYEQINTKPIVKGRQVEPYSIDLYNDVFFTNFTKNTERRENEFITGEPDLIGDDIIIDIKSSWSLATFPITYKTAYNPIYEWQLRCYMALWEKPKARLAYCMVDTPMDLISYEQAEIHEVEHIDPIKRIYTIDFERDLELESQMYEKLKHAQDYFNEILNEFNKRAA